MNKETRKKLDEFISKLEEMKEEVSQLASDERDKFDNMPEGLAGSERGEATQAAADNLESCETPFDDLISYLSDAKGE